MSFRLKRELKIILFYNMVRLFNGVQTFTAIQLGLSKSSNVKYETEMSKIFLVLQAVVPIQILKL